jgi:hypothetical protein
MRATTSPGSDRPDGALGVTSATGTPGEETRGC